MVARGFAPVLAVVSLSAGCEHHLPIQDRPRASSGAALATVAPLTKTWQRAIPLQATPEGLPSLRASDCALCHIEVYAEWKATTHAQALQDLQFQVEWKKDGKLWLCVNCHTPLENQMERIVVGLEGGDFRKPVTKPNPRFDPRLQQESITCAACHVRDSAILGAGTSGDRAPHPVRRQPRAGFQTLCERCHNMQDKLTDVLVCSFTTGDEWRASGKTGQGEGCIDCHMPPVTRTQLPDGIARPGRRHTWFGAGIAKLPEDVDSVRAAYQPGYDLEVRARVRGRGKGRHVSVSMAITNARAGHELPTGDPERFITLELTLHGRDGPGAPAWAHTERIGEVWVWSPKARQVSDNSLKSGERRDFSYEVPLPASARDGLSIELVARNHRMSVENAVAMGIADGRYPLAIEVLRKRVAVAAD